jgi:hypothetical protein
MQDLINRFLVSSHIDPIYFITGIVDVISIFLWRGLKGGLPDWQRALYKAMIFVAFVLTAGALCKFFGLITDWKELESIWSS